MGFPVAGSLFFECSAFAAAALMMGWLGATSLAAHQVALSCAAFTFMFPLGMSIAVSMRTSKALGSGRRDLLRPIGFGGLAFAAVLAGGFALAFAFAGGALARGFSHDPAVTALATRLLVVAAIFQLFDAAQVVGSGVLRGLTDVRVPTILTFVAYWVLALPVGYLLAFRAGFGPAGIWSGLAVGLACASVLLWLRFDRRTRALLRS
jgi:MATE family multidrug resistance protein